MTTLTDAAVRRSRGWLGDEPADLTAFTIALFNQVAAPDSFERGGHLVTVVRDDDSGKFGDDGLAEAVRDAATVFERSTIAGQSVAAFEDHDGGFLDKPGKGVAFRDVDELGEIEDENDLEEASKFPADQAGQVADALASAAAAARSDGPIGGLQRRATLQAAGMQIVGLNDGEGIWGVEETPYVAVSYQNAAPIDWDAVDIASGEGLQYTLFDPDEVDDLADAIRAAGASQQQLNKAGLPRKVDRLALDGRIPLDAGERLTGSASIDALHSSGLNPVVAATTGLQGPQLRIAAAGFEDRDWRADPEDGETAVLDAAGFEAFQQAMAEMRPRADQMRAELARDVLDPQQEKVDALIARKEAIQDRVYEGVDVAPEEMERIHALQSEADSRIRMSQHWDEYVATYRKRHEIQRKYIHYDPDGTIYSDPMSPEDRAEYDRLRDRTNQLHDADFNIARIDSLHNRIHAIVTPARELEDDERAEVKALNDQIHAIYNDTSGPGIDDLMFAGRIPSVKGSSDLRYEVHGSDSDWEDNPTGVGTWRIRIKPIPKSAPLDYDDGTGEDIDVYPDEIAKFMRILQKVYGTADAQVAAVDWKLHEFCLTPLHPGPCEGWKNALPDSDPRKTRAKAKAKPPTKPARAKAPAKTLRAKASRVLSDQQIQAMDDSELFDLFADLSKKDTLDEPLMRRLIADMDRREQPPALTAEQKRVDDLVAGGRDFLSAYAEVHGQDEEALKAEQGRTAVDRREGETASAAVRRSYDEFTHVNYLQAEKATRGHMLNRAGQKAGIDPLTLFTGPISRARRYASEDLQRWWAANPRMNLTQFRAAVVGGAKDKAAAAKTRQQSNARDFI